ncbi:hypothetical protein ACN28S_09020 [Cystobacter fuscus]
MAEKRAVYASSKASVNGREIPIGYETVLRSGQDLGGQLFGRMVQKDGKPVKNTDGSDFISPSNDFSSILQAGNRLFEVTHFETTPAAMYLSELRQSPDGKLSALSTRPIDFSGVDGLWTPCAGSVSPWGTHLGSEEYPPDARATEKAEAAGTVSGLSASERSMLRYWGLEPPRPPWLRSRPSIRPTATATWSRSRSTARGRRRSPSTTRRAGARSSSPM